MTVPIGQFLVQRGLLTQEACEAVLAEQRRSGRPFGEIAEEQFNVSAREVERAWADQYATVTRWVDPTVERTDPAVLGLISRRQAWQFRMMPLRYDGSEIMVVTTRQHLARALRFAGAVIHGTCYFVLTDAEQLGEALMRHYPMEGMSREYIAEVA